MRTISLIVNAGDQVLAAFKAVKEFDPTAELGPTMERLRSAETLLTVETDCVGAIEMLCGLLRLVDNMEQIGAECSLSIIDGPPKPITPGKPPLRTPRPATREDLVDSIEFEKSIAVNELPQRVLSILDSLASTTWFHAVGKTLNDGSVIQGTPLVSI